MKYRVLIPVLIILVAVVSGCKQDDEVLKTISAVDTFTNTLVQKVKSAPSPAEGVAVAQAYLDSNKRDMSAQINKMMHMRQIQISKRVQEQMKGSLEKDVEKVYQLKLDLMTDTMYDDRLQINLNNLIDQYVKLLQGEVG